jgi:D-beta-D-heptose 7-phosphate kinase/D-beta-D-heptose 1-phosphate adenosyltransferase
MQRIELEKLFARLGQSHILVVGDLMLDEYLWGSTDRISPEAPVPVVDIARQDLRLGGAGNVIHNLITFGCQVHVAGVIGDDADGMALRQLLDALHIDTAGVFGVAGRTTSRKTRILATNQQMLRIDRESREAINAATEERLVQAVETKISGLQALILSDYGKGLLTPSLLSRIIDLGRRFGVPVLVDPKGADFTRYRRATLLTPNRKEAQQAAGRTTTSEAELVELGSAMRRDLELDALLITRSEAGMSLFVADQVHHLPTAALEVYDVSGAGDTVIAMLGAALAAGVALPDAADLANLAAGIVVGKVGTSTVRPGEILDAAGRRHLDTDLKIRSRDALAGLLEEQRRNGRKVVFTNGCFDLLHVGHVKYLQAARRLGDLLVLGLNSDASIQRLKGPQRPLIGQEERGHILAALNCIDYVVIFDEDTPLELIHALRPDILVKGGDYTPEGVVGKDLVENYGGRVELIQFVDGKSTTNIIDKILTQYGEK